MLFTLFLTAQKIAKAKTPKAKNVVTNSGIVSQYTLMQYPSFSLFGMGTSYWFGGIYPINFRLFIFCGPLTASSATELWHLGRSNFESIAPILVTKIREEAFKICFKSYKCIYLTCQRKWQFVKIQWALYINIPYIKNEIYGTNSLFIA